MRGSPPPHLHSGRPAVLHHVQQGELMAQLLDGQDLVEAQTGDRVHQRFCEGRRPHLTHSARADKGSALQVTGPRCSGEGAFEPALPSGDVGERPLPGHQDALLVETPHHLQRAVGQNHLLGGDLSAKAGLRGAAAAAGRAEPAPTCTCSSWESCRALWRRWQLPALVRKTTGSTKRRSLSSSFPSAR